MHAPSRVHHRSWGTAASWFVRSRSMHSGGSDPDTFWAQAADHLESVTQERCQVPDGGAFASRFISWFRGCLLESEHTQSHVPKCIPQSFPVEGPGMAADTRIAAGECVLRVPPSVWSRFSSERVVAEAKENAPLLVQRIEELSQFPGTRLLELSLMSLDLLMNHNMTASEPGSEYVAWLQRCVGPAQLVPAMPCFWGEDSGEVNLGHRAEELQASPLRPSITRLHTLCSALHSHIFADPRTGVVGECC